MKAVICLSLVLAVVAAEVTENYGYTNVNVKGSTPATIVKQSTISNNQGNIKSFPSFGNQNVFSGNLFEAKSPYSFSKSSTGFSLTHPSTFGKQEILTSRYQSGSAVPIVASKSNGLSYGYGVSGVNGASLNGKYGLAKDFQYSYPTAGYGYNTYGYGSNYRYGISESQAKIAHVDTQVRVDTTQQKHINTLHTITKQIPVEQPYPVPYQVVKTVAVPQPYPVPVVKAVPVPYQVRVPVQVDKPIPVKVAHQVPVPVRVNVPYPVEKPYPVTVEKIVKVPVERPVYVRVPQPVAVHVPQPYPVKVVKKYPVEVPTPVVVKVPEIINVHKVEYAVAPVQYHGCAQHSHHNVPVEVPIVAQSVPISEAAISESVYGDALASQVNTANFEALNSGYGVNGAYQIQPAQLVGVYHEPTYQGTASSIIDAKYSFKRETKEQKQRNTDRNDV